MYIYYTYVYINWSPVPPLEKRTDAPGYSLVVFNTNPGKPCNCAHDSVCRGWPDGGDYCHAVFCYRRLDIASKINESD